MNQSATKQQVDAIIEQLRGEFIDEAEENLNSVDIHLENLRSRQETPEEALISIRRQVHSLKGSSSVADYPLVAMVMHRMEDYMADIADPNKKQITNIQIFSDKARDLVKGRAGNVSSAELVRQLPGKEDESDGGGELENAAAPASKIEALMVVKEKIVGQIFERELRQSGLRVTTVNSSFYAIEMAVRSQPDFIVLSAVLDDLSGIDVSRALKALPATENIPIGVLTSFEKGHSELQGLPENVMLIQKNNLKEDLLNSLKEFKLIS